MNSVRSRRPSSRMAAATPFCRGWEANWRMISDAVKVPVRMDAITRRISDQRARMSATSHRAEGKDMIGISAAIGVVPTHGDLALVIEERVQHMQSLACR